MARKVLIIEDEEDVAQVMFDRIESWGLEPIIADSGKGGLESLERLRPDIVLLDIHLPDQNGLDVLRQIRQEFADLPVIIVSASHSPRVEARAREAGATDFVLKPYEPAELKKKIYGAFGEPED